MKINDFKIVSELDEERSLDIEKPFDNANFIEMAIEGPEYQGIKGYGVISLSIKETIQLRNHLSQIISNLSGD